MTVLGFDVEKKEVRPGDDVVKEAYIFSDKDGPRYALLRTVRNPFMLFAIHMRKMGVARIKGYSWFSDKDGKLTPSH